MISPADIHHGFSSARISAALKDISNNVPNKAAWIGRSADGIGVDERSFKGYLYGEQTPTVDTLQRMGLYFGTGFLSAVFGDIGIHCIKATDLDIIQSGELLKLLKLLIPQLRGVLSDAEKEVLKVVA